MLQLTDSAKNKLVQLKAKGNTAAEQFLRLTVEGGGCSGFKYLFNLTSICNPEDHVFSFEGTKLIVDSISLPFIQDATIDYVNNLMGSYFQVSSNPQAKKNCGCGSSFSV